jgi:hypothetical protein
MDNDIKSLKHILRNTVSYNTAGYVVLREMGTNPETGTVDSKY